MMKITFDTSVYLNVQQTKQGHVCSTLDVRNEQILLPSPVIKSDYLYCLIKMIIITTAVVIIVLCLSLNNIRTCALDGS